MQSTTQTYKHYYPFGLKHGSYYSTANIKLAKKELNELVPQNLLDGNIKIKPTTDRAYKYKYNGKEWQDELGLAWYDYGARNYEPSLGRFMSIDPMTDFTSYQSPYVIADNNPIQNIDYYGLGIFNVVGNLFKRLKNSVSNLFRKGCSKRYVQETIGVAWSRDDFPSHKNRRRNRRRNRNTTPNSDNNSGSTRDYISPIPTSNLQLASLGTQLNTELQLTSMTTRPYIDNPIHIPATGNLSLDIRVRFKSNQNKFRNVDYTEKILSDLIKTLIIYPQLIVTILGNASYNNKNISDKSRVTINGQSGTVGQLQLTRAQAIKQFFIDKGVDPKRIIAKKGIIDTSGKKSNISATFIIKNN